MIDGLLQDGTPLRYVAAAACAALIALPAAADARVIHDSDAGHLRKGTAHRDSIYGHGGNDVLWGFRRADRIYGGTGYDRLRGGRGRDLLIDRRGGADIWGGRGEDVIRVRRPGNGAHVRGGRGDDRIHLFGPFRSRPYVGVSAEGGPGNDRVRIHGGLGWVKVFLEGDGKRDHVWCDEDSYDLIEAGPLDVVHNRAACDSVS